MMLMNEGFVPEFGAANGVMNDVAIRVQQCLIALDMYETQLEKVDKLLPDGLMIGTTTRDCDMAWGSAKNAKGLIETQKRAKQFVVLSGVNTVVNLLDDYMKQLLIKYWDVKPMDGDESWFSLDGFEMISGVKLASVKYHEAVDDFRMSASRMKLFNHTRRLNVRDFFDCIVQINDYMRQLGHLAMKKVADDVQAKSEIKPLELPPQPPEPPKNFGLGGEEGTGGEEFDGNE